MLSRYHIHHVRRSFFFTINLSKHMLLIQGTFVAVSPADIHSIMIVYGCPRTSKKANIRKTLAFWIFRDPRVYQTHHGFLWKSKKLRKWKPEACLRITSIRTTFLEVRGHP